MKGFEGWTPALALPENFTHRRTGIVVYRVSVDQPWMISLPKRGDQPAVVMTLMLGGEAERALRLAENGHVSRFVEMPTEPVGDDVDEWAQRVFRRMRYDMLCALQTYGLGAYGNQRIEDYARERGITLPGMTPPEAS